MIIVGIDISKRSHEAAIINENGTLLMKPFRFSNHADGLQKLLEKLKGYPDEQVAFGMEATGHYWLSIYSRLTDLGYAVHVINPMQTDSFRNMYIRKSKNDTWDSFLIAEVIRFGRFTESGMPPSVLYTLRELSRNRFFLIDMRSDLKRKIVTLLDQVFPEYETVFSNTFGLTSTAVLAECPTPAEILQMDPERLCQLIEAPSRKRFGMKKVEELKEKASKSFGIAISTDVFSTMIKSYIKHIQFITEQINTLEERMNQILEELNTTITSITGIGPVLAATILSEIGDISRFPSACKLAAFSGIDPTMKQSGEYTGIRNRMSKRGSPYLRRAVWMAATVAAQHDPALNVYYLKKRAEGKPHMNAIGHVSRKMISIIYAVMRDNKTYCPVMPA